MIDTSDPQARNKLLLGVMLVGGLGYLGYQNFYLPRAEEIAEMETRLEALELRNGAARRIADDKSRADVELRLRLYRDQLGRVENLIPSTEELPDLLDAISEEAQRSGVELTLIQPVGATQEQFYTRRTYELAVAGSYHQIAEFLTYVGSLPRIVTPINLTVAVQQTETRSGEPKLEAKFAIETYVLPSLEIPVDTAHAE